MEVSQIPGYKIDDLKDYSTFDVGIAITTNKRIVEPLSSSSNMKSTFKLRDDG
ncbi:MAG: hypothetical protein OEM52_09080 [bacterium]|nr:hypothetical protein [bacterium]